MPKTREKIIDAAWKLFSKDGFEAVSVRDVTNEAGVNLASVSYHFSGKDGLIQEIVAKALVPLNKQRVLLLKKAGDEIGRVEDVPLERIIEAFVRPIVCPEEFGGCADMIAQLMARYLIDRDYDVPPAVMESFGDVYKIFSIAIAEQCPGMDLRKALEKLVFSTGAVFMFQSFSGLASKATGGAVDFSMDDFLADAVTFCAAGFKS